MTSIALTLAVFAGGAQMTSEPVGGFAVFTEFLSNELGSVVFLGYVERGRVHRILDFGERRDYYVPDRIVKSGTAMVVMISDPAGCFSHYLLFRDSNGAFIDRSIADSQRGSSEVLKMGKYLVGTAHVGMSEVPHRVGNYLYLFRAEELIVGRLWRDEGEFSLRSHGSGVAKVSHRPPMQNRETSYALFTLSNRIEGDRWALNWKPLIGAEQRRYTR